MKKIFTIVALALCTLAMNAQHVARTMDFEGTSRKYMEYIPTSSPDGSMPVIFLLHGLGDNCNNFSNLHFESVAPNWIIITPEATEATINIMGMYSMNAGTAWAAGVGGENITYSGLPIGNIELNANVNDEGFILAILDSLENNFNVDTDSVFVAGFSMGGFMSNKMAVKHADRIKAVASVSGTLGHFQAFEPTGNINTMHIHGTSDETISYANADFNFNGVAVPVGLGAETLVETWRNYNQCSTEPIVYNFENTKNDGLTFEQYIYKNEESGHKTVFIKVNNGVHDWYDGSSHDIDYNTEIYKFFTGQEPEGDTITTIVGNGGTITPHGTIIVDDGADQTFTIAADEHYRIVSVIVDAETENEADITEELVDGIYSFANVTTNHTITATFEAITYTIEATTNEFGTIAPASITVIEGENASFTITANDSCRLVSVMVDGENNVTDALENGVYTFENVTANHTIAATFERIPTFTITATAEGNGTITPAGENVVMEGENISFTVTANESNRIASVMVDGTNNVTEQLVNDVYTFTNVTTNHTIVVTFVESNSVDMFEVASMAIYPNPNNGIFNIDFCNFEGKATYQLINARGTVVETHEINVMNGKNMKFNHNLKAGIYFVRIIADDKVYVEQIIVE